MARPRDLPGGVYPIAEPTDEHKKLKVDAVVVHHGKPYAYWSTVYMVMLMKRVAIDPEIELVADAISGSYIPTIADDE